MPILRKKSPRPSPSRRSTTIYSSDSAEPHYAESASYTTPPIISPPSTIVATPSNVSPLKSLQTPRLVVTADGLEDAMPEVYNDVAPSPGAVSDGDDSIPRRHRDSIVQRVADRLSSPTNESKKRPHRRQRRSSTASAMSQGHSIAAALAKSSLPIAPPNEELHAPKAGHARAVSAGRSPYLLRPDDESDDGYGTEDESIEGSDSDLDHLPVTGFAVASNRRNAEFHQLFPTVDEGDYLIEDYGCALAKDILVHGRLYLSENHLCFHSNLFGWVTDVVIPFADVQEIEKKMTAIVIPNAIGVSTAKERHTFASLISRDSTFDVMMNIWRIAHPGAVMKSSTAANGASRSPSPVNGEAPMAGKATGGAGHKATDCVCSKEGKHYSEVALDTTFPSTPEKTYNLMFNSGWYRTFLIEDQKLRDLESSDWRPDADGKLMRSTTYIKPLNGSIGPRQTKCHITDVHEHIDVDDYISMVTTTRTPDVPSGGVFSVKTRTCLTWASAISTRVLVTTEVEWTGKSWVKGVIEKSAIDGQKQYHNDLAKGMRAYMKEHASEFFVAGANAADAEAADAPESPTEAQEYAAQNRKARQDQDYWALQGALDSVTGGVKSIASGLRAAFDSISDLLPDLPVSKTLLTLVFIAILLIFNIYTYLARPASSHRVKRLQRFGPSEDDVTEAVRIILHRRAAVTPKDEVADLLGLLDEIETRAAKLRAALLQAREEGGSLADLD